MSIFVRSFAETYKIQRGQVYQVTDSPIEGNVRLLPMFGKYAGPAGCTDIPRSVYDAFVEAENFVFVQPMKRNVTKMKRVVDGDESLHFFHTTMDGTVCWINAETSGTMPSLDFWHFEPFKLD